MRARRLAFRAMVRIREVGPRDGFQNEPEVIPTADKVRLIDLLARTGLQRLEVTSFVRADVIPQLADAAEVLAADRRARTASRSRADPERARARRTRSRSATASTRSTSSCRRRETHNRKNVNRSIEESLAGAGARARAARGRRGCAARA